MFTPLGRRLEVAGVSWLAISKFLLDFGGVHMGFEKLLAVIEKSHQDPKSVVSLSELSQAIHEIICTESSKEYKINECFTELRELVDERKALSRKQFLDKALVTELTQYKKKEEALLLKLISIK
ncbi:hypothetical protein PJ912_03495 [Pectobacterium colocasium]|uniref:hypothetical protein n=1 Tax=Pectobacterium TaxID=122277 RepID=UPI0027A3CBCA|nr:hypothetical protein PJ912_03495 [Pectobacterium colocasium]